MNWNRNEYAKKMKEGKKMRNAYVSATTPNDDDDDDIIEALSKYAFNSQILLVSYIIEHPILLSFISLI